MNVANDQFVPLLDYSSILQLDDFQSELSVYVFHVVKINEILPIQKYIFLLN